MTSAVCIIAFMSAGSAWAQEYPGELDPDITYIPVHPGDEAFTAVLSFPLSATYNVTDIAYAMDVFGVSNTEELPVPLQTPDVPAFDRLKSVIVTFENLNDPNDPRGISFDPEEDLMPLDPNPFLSGVGIFKESGDARDRFNFTAGDPTSDIGLDLKPVSEETLEWIRDEENPNIWRVKLVLSNFAGLNELSMVPDGFADYHIAILPTIDLHQEDQFRAYIEPSGIEVEHRYQVGRRRFSLNLSRYPVRFPSLEFLFGEPPADDAGNVILDDEGNPLPYNPYAILPGFEDVDEDRNDVIGFQGLYTDTPVFFGDIVRIVPLTIVEAQIDANSDAFTVFGIDLMGLEDEEYFVSLMSVDFIGMDLTTIYQNLDPFLGFGEGIFPQPDPLLAIMTGSVIQSFGLSPRVMKYLQGPEVYKRSPPAQSFPIQFDVPVEDQVVPYPAFHPAAPPVYYTAGRGHSGDFRIANANWLAPLQSDNVGGVVLFADNKDDANNTPFQFDRGIDTLVTLDADQIFRRTLDVPAMAQSNIQKVADGTHGALERLIPGTVGDQGFAFLGKVTHSLVMNVPIFNILPSSVQSALLGGFDVIFSNEGEILGFVPFPKEIPPDSLLTPNHNESWEYVRDLWLTHKPILGISQPNETGIPPILRQGYPSVMGVLLEDWELFADDDPEDPTTLENNPTTTASRRFFGGEVVGGFSMTLPVGQGNPEGAVGVPDSDDADFGTEEPELFVAIRTSNQVRNLDVLYPFMQPGNLLVGNRLSSFNQNPPDPGSPPVQEFLSVASVGFGQRGRAPSHPILVRPKPKFTLTDLTVPPSGGESGANQDNLLKHSSVGSPPKAVIGINAVDFGRTPVLAEHPTFYPDRDKESAPIPLMLNSTFLNESMVFDGITVDIIPTDTEREEGRYQSQSGGGYSGLDIVRNVDPENEIIQFLGRNIMRSDLALYMDDDTPEGDGIDNDGDGLVDEELRNVRDDDGDGLVDEDVGDGDGWDPLGNGTFDVYDDFMPFEDFPNRLATGIYINGPVVITGLTEIVWTVDIGSDGSGTKTETETTVGGTGDEATFTGIDPDVLSVVLNLHPLQANTSGGLQGFSPNSNLIEPWVSRVNLWAAVFAEVLARPGDLEEIDVPLIVFEAVIEEPAEDPEAPPIERMNNPGGVTVYDGGANVPRQLYNLVARNLPALSPIQVVQNTSDVSAGTPRDTGPFEIPSIYFPFNNVHGAPHPHPPNNDVQQLIGMNEGPMVMLQPLAFGDLGDNARVATSLAIGNPDLNPDPSTWMRVAAINTEAYRIPLPSAGLFSRIGIVPCIVTTGPTPEDGGLVGELNRGMGPEENPPGAAGMNQWGGFNGVGDDITDFGDFLTTDQDALREAITSWVNDFLQRLLDYSTNRAEQQEEYENTIAEWQEEVAATESEDEPPEKPEFPEDGLDFEAPDPQEPSLTDALVSFALNEIDLDPPLVTVSYLMDIPDEDIGPLAGNDFFVVLRASDNADVNDKFVVRIQPGQREQLIPDPTDPEADPVTLQPQGLLYSTYINLHDSVNLLDAPKGQAPQSITTGEITVRSNNEPPTLRFLTPGPGQNVTNRDLEYVISWDAFDPDNVAIISLYVDTDNLNFDGQLVATNLLEGEADSFLINLPEDIDNFDPLKEYFVYGTITDSVNQAFSVYSDGSIVVSSGGGQEGEDPLTADVVDYYKLERSGVIRVLGQGPLIQSILGLSDLGQIAVDFELTSNYSGALVVSDRGLLFASGDIGGILSEDVSVNGQLVLPGNPATDLTPDPSAPVIDFIVDVEVDFINGAVYVLDRDGEILALGEGSNPDFQRKITGDEAGQDRYRDMELSPTAQGLYLLRTDGSVEIVGNAEGGSGNGPLFDESLAADMSLTLSGVSVQGVIITDEFGNLVSRGAQAPRYTLGLPLEENRIRSIAKIPQRTGDYLLMTGGGLIIPATSSRVSLPRDLNVFGDAPGRGDDNVVDIEAVPFNLQSIPLLIEQVLSAISAEDLNAFMSLVSNDYNDFSGNDIQAVRQAMGQYFRFFEIESFQSPDDTSQLNLNLSGDRVTVAFTVGYAMFNPRVDLLPVQDTGATEALVFETGSIPPDQPFLPFSQDIRFREIFDGRGWSVEVMHLTNAGNEDPFTFDPANLDQGQGEAVLEWERLKRLPGNEVVYNLFPRRARGVEGEKLVHVNVDSYRDINALVYALRQHVLATYLAPPVMEVNWYDGDFTWFDVGSVAGTRVAPNVLMQFVNREGNFELTGFIWPQILRIHTGGLTTTAGEIIQPNQDTTSVENPDGFSFLDRGPVVTVQLGEADFVMIDADNIGTVTPRAGLLSLGQNVDIFTISAEEILANRTRSSFLTSQWPLILGESYAIMTRDLDRFGLITYTAPIGTADAADPTNLTVIGMEFYWRFDDDNFVFPPGF